MAEKDRYVKLIETGFNSPPPINDKKQMIEKIFLALAAVRAHGREFSCTYNEAHLFSNPDDTVTDGKYNHMRGTIM